MLRTPQPALEALLMPAGPVNVAYQSVPATILVAAYAIKPPQRRRKPSNARVGIQSKTKPRSAALLIQFGKQLKAQQYKATRQLRAGHAFPCGECPLPSPGKMFLYC